LSKTLFKTQTNHLFFVYALIDIKELTKPSKVLENGLL
jgi:hypothetical protein